VKHPSGMALEAPRSGLTWLLGFVAGGMQKRLASERPAVPARGTSRAWPKRGPCVRGPWPRDGGASTRGPGWRRLTFELSRPRKQVGLAVRPMMSQGGCAAKPACRSGSALERGVRPHPAATR
jgi:hypothetical protein